MLMSTAVANFRIALLIIDRSADPLGSTIIPPVRFPNFNLP
jgi:hypothetical protein